MFDCVLEFERLDGPYCWMLCCWFELSLPYCCTPDWVFEFDRLDGAYCWTLPCILEFPCPYCWTPDWTFELDLLDGDHCWTPDCSFEFPFPICWMPVWEFEFDLLDGPYCWMLPCTFELSLPYCWTFDWTLLFDRRLIEYCWTPFCEFALSLPYCWTFDCWLLFWGLAALKSDGKKYRKLRNKRVWSTNLEAKARNKRNKVLSLAFWLVSSLEVKLKPKLGPMTFIYMRSNRNRKLTNKLDKRDKSNLINDYLLDLLCRFDLSFRFRLQEFPNLLHL